MEQRALKNLNICLNTKIYSYLDTFGGQSSNPYLNAVIFSTPELIRNLWQFKTAVFLHWCLICAIPLEQIEGNSEKVYKMNFLKKMEETVTLSIFL